MAPLSNSLLRIPGWLTAPDALIAIILASYLQYKQYARIRQQKNKVKIHAGAKTKPKRDAATSLVHEWLFTHLRMMVSPFASQATDLNADLVDLKSDEDLNSYAKKVASGNAPKSTKKAKAGGRGTSGDEKTMEVRSRRLVRGEMVHDTYYPALETSVNLALATLVGLVSRWFLGLFRSLRLSIASSNPMSLSGPGGPCCSSYTGADDEGTRLPGSFERLLACVLIKNQGDNAGTWLLSLLLLTFLVGVVKLAWSVSSPLPSNAREKDDGDDVDENDEKTKESAERSAPTYKRVHPKKVKRFIVGMGATLFSLWIFHTPALLRALGLAGLTEAAEEWSARVLLFGNLLGVVTLPETNTLEAPAEPLENLTNLFLAILALALGYISAGMMTPIEETARNAAYILSPSHQKKGVKMNPNEMFELINVRIMLLIQAMAPFLVTCTYLFNSRFAEMTKVPVRGQMQSTSFSKTYFTNSNLLVRAVFSWCFVAACFYTFRAILQSYLDQASTVASAMAALGEGVASSDAKVSQGAGKKRPTTTPSSPPKSDPFTDRYKNVVLTACRVGAYPAFVLIMLATAHLLGGDGATHPGVGHVSQPRDAPRSILPVKGLLPPYSNQFMSLIAKRNSSGAGAGDELLHETALSQASWDTNPFRDAAHKKLVDVVGRNKFCYPPETRSVKALGRHVNFLLDSDSDETSVLTMTALTGRELLDMAPQVPTLLDSLSGRNPVGGYSGGERSCESESTQEEECSAAVETHPPTLSEMVSALMAHKFLTPTVIFPVIDTVAFCGSMWWNFWYSFMMAVYWIRLQRSAAFLRISA